MKLRQLSTDIRSTPDKYLLATLVFLLPFERIPSVDALGITLRLSFFAAGLVILRACYLVMRKRRNLFAPDLTRKILVVFLVWVAVSGLAAINIPRAIQVIVFTWFTALTALSAGVLYKKQYLEFIVKALLASAVIVACFGVFQYIGNLAGLPNSITGLRDVYSWQVFGFPRIQSTGLEPLYFCSYMLIPASVVLGRLLWGRDSSWKMASLLLLFSTIIFLTVSRGGIYALVGMSAFMVIYAMWLRRTTLRRTISVVATVVLGFIISLIIITYFAKPPVNKTITGGKKGTAGYTKQLQNTGLEAGGDDRAKSRRAAIIILNQDKVRYVFGVGAGQYGPYAQNNIKRPQDGWLIVNNEPIELLLELGLIGFGLFTLFIGSLLWRASRYIKEPKDAQSGIIAFGLLGYLFATAIQYQTFSTLYIMHIWVAIGLLMAIVAKVPATVKKKAR